MDIRETKISIGTIITGVSVVAGALYINSLWSLAKKAQVQASARVHKIDFNGITIVCSVTVLNPTNGTVTVRHPYVSLFASPKMQENRIPFAHSAISNQTHTIIPNGETRLPDVVLFIPTTSILQVAADMLADGKVELVANIKTRVTTKWLIGKEFDKNVSLKIDVNALKQVLGQAIRTEEVLAEPLDLLEFLMETTDYTTAN
jgi:hypothetical protein